MFFLANTIPICRVVAFVIRMMQIYSIHDETMKISKYFPIYDKVSKVSIFAFVSIALVIPAL